MYLRYSMFAILLIVNLVAFADKADSVSGFWKSYNEKGQIESYWNVIIKDDYLKASLVHVPGHSDDEKATGGSLKGVPMIGTFWIDKMKKVDSCSWGNGKIINPVMPGKFDCNLRAINNDSLQIRFYIGFSFLGTKELWVRTSENEIKIARQKSIDYLNKKTSSHR